VFKIGGNDMCCWCPHS